MSNFRFKVGATVMCNLGPNGWKLGRVVALHYREDHWPAKEVAPYQVSLEDDHTLIYVPEDDVLYCREPTVEDLRIARRMDALAAFPIGVEVPDILPDSESSTGSTLCCADRTDQHDVSGYRSGHCHCCDPCPRNWSSVDLYSEHYRCVARNGLKVTRRAVDLGKVSVGTFIDQPARERYLCKEGFLQCPTLVRLPPGIEFSDDGSLRGEIQFDPHQDSTYRVDFVAVSTANWSDDTIGVVRLELSFVVEGNDPPDTFDADGFKHEQDLARQVVHRLLDKLYTAWDMWERQRLSNRETITRMCAELGRLRRLLEQHPKLDGGRWWVQLGGLHMNIHKLLENTLFECELYLGHALTFADAEVRQMAEQNLKGCYQKRLLEAARFMWIDGIELMMQGRWAKAVETLQSASAQNNGWGWAVNYGDIWISESAARLICAGSLESQEETDTIDRAAWIAESRRLLERAMRRANESGVFEAQGHPWANEISAAIGTYLNLQDNDADISEWLQSFILRTHYWCAQVLGGAPPFPPQPRPRLEDAAVLTQRLPH